MIKITSLGVLFLIATLNSGAQQKLVQMKDKFKELQTILKMDKNEFTIFKHNLAMYNDSTVKVANEKYSSKEERISAINRIVINRTIYLKKYLSETQYSLFVEFEKEMQNTPLRRKLINGDVIKK